MEELFVLARSSFQQQKIFSLQILSCIVKRVSNICPFSVSICPF